MSEPQPPPRPQPAEKLKNLIELARLHRFDQLFLSGQRLSEVPEEVGDLIDLVTLDLSNNTLEELPAVLAHLVNLRELNLANNSLKELPTWIGSFPKLESLDLSENLLTSLPPTIGLLEELRKLELRDNALSALPNSLSRLAHLESISIEGNPALGIPDELLRKEQLVYDGQVYEKQAFSGKELIHYYLAEKKRAAESGTRLLNEAKVLVLGEAEVGKSSLILALSEGVFDRALPKTHGIVQKEWILNFTWSESNCEPETLRLNLWDFGGQEVYHATHTFFLTHRAVYLLVADARANDRQNNLEYWLQMAASFGGGAPVWIAVNKCDQHGDGPDEHALRRKFPSIIRGFVRTSCVDGTGIEPLKQHLLSEALSLEGVRQPMNNIWLNIKAALEENKQDTIPISEYLRMCGEKGETDEDIKFKLLDLWDKLGTVRYFPTRPDDPPEMRDTAILNPEWATKAVYAVLDDDAIRARGGLVTENDIERILRGFAAGRQRLIEQVMRRFDLLYDTSDHDPHKMLVPQLLPERQPEIDWPRDGILRFIYRYPVLPASLVPTFIARMHARLSGKPGPWRHGCVLDFGDCRALIIGDTEAKQVEISVGGQPLQSRDALDAVRFAFENIHGAIKDLKVEELIPVPGRSDAPLLKYRHLRSLEFSEISTLPAEGAEAGEIIEVNVREVLNGVRGKHKERSETNQYMGDHIEQHFHAGTFNAPIGINQTFANCYSSAKQVTHSETQEALRRLILEVEKIHANLAANEQVKAQSRLKTLMDAAIEAEPDKEQIAFSGRGLIDAAETCAKVASPVVTAVKAVASLFGVLIP